MANPREQLKTVLQGIWRQPDMQKIASAERQDTKGAYAACLRKEMDNGTAGVEGYKKCAQESGLREKFESLWPD